MRLRIFLVILTLTVIAGYVGWKYFLNGSRKQIYSLNETSFLAEDAEKRVNTEYLHRTPMPISIANLEDPFFIEPCFFWKKDSCLPSFVVEASTFRFSSGKFPDEQLNPFQLYVAMGDIVGKPDNIRAYFARQAKPAEKYVQFVKDIQGRSLENQLTPSLTYAYYDYLFSKKEMRSSKDFPNPSVGINLISLGMYIFEKKGISQAEPILEEPEDWSSYGKSLLYATWWGFLDNNLVETAFADKGKFESFYLQRFSKKSDAITYVVAVEPDSITEGEYFSVDTDITGLALCYQSKAMICQLETAEDQSTGTARCRPATFLNTLCGDTLLPLY